MADKFDIAEHIKVEALGTREGIYQDDGTLLINGKIYDSADYYVIIDNVVQDMTLTPTVHDDQSGPIASFGHYTGDGLNALVISSGPEELFDGIGEIKVFKGTSAYGPWEQCLAWNEGNYIYRIFITDPSIGDYARIEHYDENGVLTGVWITQFYQDTSGWPFFTTYENVSPSFAYNSGYMFPQAFPTTSEADIRFYGLNWGQTSVSDISFYRIVTRGQNLSYEYYVLPQLFNGREAQYTVRVPTVNSNRAEIFISAIKTNNQIIQMYEYQIETQDIDISSVGTQIPATFRSYSEDIYVENPFTTTDGLTTVTWPVATDANFYGYDVDYAANDGYIRDINQNTARVRLPESGTLNVRKILHDGYNFVFTIHNLEPEVTVNSVVGDESADTFVITTTFNEVHGGTAYWYQDTVGSQDNFTPQNIGDVWTTVPLPALGPTINDPTQPTQVGETDRYRIEYNGKVCAVVYVYAEPILLPPVTIGSQNVEVNFNNTHQFAPEVLPAFINTPDDSLTFEVGADGRTYFTFTTKTPGLYKFIESLNKDDVDGVLAAKYIPAAPTPDDYMTWEFDVILEEWDGQYMVLFNLSYNSETPRVFYVVPNETITVTDNLEYPNKDNGRLSAIAPTGTPNEYVLRWLDNETVTTGDYYIGITPSDLSHPVYNVPRTTYEYLGQEIEIDMYETTVTLPESFYMTFFRGTDYIFDTQIVGNTYFITELYQPTTTSEATATGWWPINCSVSRAEIEQAYEIEKALLKRPVVGTCSLELKGLEGDPRANSALSIDNKIRVMLAKEAHPDDPASDEYLFTGFIESLSTTYDPFGNALTTIECVDGLSKALNVNIPLYDFTTAESFSRRMFNVFNDYIAPVTSGVTYDPSTWQVFEAFDRSVFPQELREEVTSSEVIEELTQGEYGILIQTRGGVIQWYSRGVIAAILNGAQNMTLEPSWYGFSTEHSTSLDHFCISDFTIRNSIEDITNKVVVRLSYDDPEFGVSATYQDAASIAYYGERAYEIELNLEAPSGDPEFYIQRWADEVPFSEAQAELESVTTNVVNRQGYVTRAFEFDANLEPARIFINVGAVDFNGVLSGKRVVHQITPENWTMTLELTAD